MALSIKANEPEMPVLLMSNMTALADLSIEMLNVFDRHITLAMSHYTQQGIERFLKAKTYLYDLSPFEETIYLDVDALWLPGRKPSELFDNLCQTDFTIGCHTVADMKTCEAEKPGYIFWGDLKRIKQYYKIKDGKMPQTQSAFIYFKKSDKIKAYFDLVKQIYDDEQAPYTPWINDGKGDEYAFNVASLLSGIMPHQVPYYPTHFFTIAPILNDADLCKQYYAIQMGGGKCAEWIIKSYNQFVEKYYQDAGVSPGFWHQDKNKAIEERAGW
jgi:hypothetical protein